jgi:hypothetical protein
VDASNLARKQTAARGAPRRPDCSRRASEPACSTECGQRAPGALTVVFRVIPLEGPDADKLRERQLAVIVRLLQRAAAEASVDALPAGDVGPRE